MYFEDEETGEVTLAMDRADYLLLMYLLGLATGTRSREHDKNGVEQLFKLADRLNEGNPNWRPYFATGSSQTAKEPAAK
jgi:hypothetical protein